jgi:hypothetical protein
LPPGGSQLYCPAGAFGASELTAGFFSVFRGWELAAGDHVLIQERSAHETTVRHPLGADTYLVAGYPLAERAGARYLAEAIGPEGERLGMTEAIATAEGLKFLYKGEVNGRRVEHYRLQKQRPLYVPILLR